MPRGYPAGAWGIPDIRVPAECPTFMGFALGFIGGPVKPPLSAILLEPQVVETMRRGLVPKVARSLQRAAGKKEGDELASSSGRPATWSDSSGGGALR